MTSMETTVIKLNERNYHQWAVEVETGVRGQVLWKDVTGEMCVLRLPMVPSTGSGTSTTKVAT